MKLSVYLLIVFLAIGHDVICQPKEEPYKIYGALQFWMRYTELNPGSSVGTDVFDQTFDISIRRYRLGVKGQVNKYFSYNLQIGHNNLSRYKKDQPPKVLDAYADLKFSEKLIFTGGKHAWTGLSRFAAPSTLSATGTDINFSATPCLNVHDDFFRRLAIATRGQLWKLDYRVIFSKPFTYSSKPLSERAEFVDNPTAMNISGYVKYQFADKEGLSSAFSPWTYLGEKEIFNIGAGWTYQEAATRSLTSAGDTVDHPMRSFAADIFYEKPSGKNVWTFYLSYLNHDLGPNFVRYIGANNPASGETENLTLNGKGNSFPEAGTGQILFGNFAYLRKFETFDLQPNFMIEIASFDALEEPMILYEAGINYLMNGQKSKVSLGVKSRPIFIDEGDGAVVDERRIMAVLQYQVRF